MEKTIDLMVALARPRHTGRIARFPMKLTISEMHVELRAAVAAGMIADFRWKRVFVVNHDGLKPRR